MNRDIVSNLLVNSLGYSKKSIEKLVIYEKLLLKWNKKYNLVSNSTLKSIWSRHFLDSAQILQYLHKDKDQKIADLGSGAGFPGILICLYDNLSFHVKLYEKSPVKRKFLQQIKKDLSLNYEILSNVYDSKLDSDVLVCRAFKKLDEILKISREKIRKPHKIIILKGKNALKEINSVYLNENYSYKLTNSMTDKESKIILFEVK